MIDVVAQTAGEQVGGAVGLPVECVGEVIAGRVGRVTAGQVEPFEVVAENPADRAVDDVVAFVGRFDDLVAGAINGVAVVTGTADQRVGAEAAIQSVLKNHL